MAKKQIVVPFPSKGVWRGGAFDEIPAPGYAADALNCWSLDSSTGRRRGGIRPPRVSLGSTGAGEPYYATAFSYTASSVTHVALGLTGANGTYISDDADTFTQHVVGTLAPGTLTWPDIATNAYYQGYLYQAIRGAANVRRRDFIGGSEETLSASAGSVPTECGIVHRHGNRLWLMMDEENPHVYYASKQGDPRNWDYTNVTDAGAFVSTGNSGGTVSAPISACISHNDQCLLIGSTDSIDMIPGSNPRRTGCVSLSTQVGPVTHTAWCKDDKGNTWFVSRNNGLYVIPAGTGSRPESVSAQALPNALLNIKPESGHTVAIGYDHRWEGIHIFVNKGTDESYYYDIKERAIWPQSFSTMPAVAISHPPAMTDNRSSIVMFTSEAFQFRKDLEGGDAAETRDSYIWIPIPIAGPDDEGILHSIVATLAESSADTNWAIHVGDSAEEAFNSDAAYTGTAWSYAAGPPERYLNYREHPRVRGAYCFIKVSDSSDNRWLLEKINCEIIAISRRRV
jgi:hypothetical protein